MSEPTKKLYTPRIHQHSAGRADRPMDHFSDVRRACERWLFKNDEQYRNASELQKARMAGTLAPSDAQP